MPNDPVRISVIRLLEAAVIGGVIMYGGYQVIGSKVAYIEQTIRDHNGLGGHPTMEARMAAQESTARWRENEIAEIKASLQRIEDKVDSL